MSQHDAHTARPTAIALVLVLVLLLANIARPAFHLMEGLGWINLLAVTIYTPLAAGFALAPAVLPTTAPRRYGTAIAWALGSLLLLIPTLQWWGFAASAAIGLALWSAPRAREAAAHRRDARRAQKWLSHTYPSRDRRWTATQWAQAHRQIGAPEPAWITLLTDGSAPRAGGAR